MARSSDSTDQETYRITSPDDPRDGMCLVVLGAQTSGVHELPAGAELTIGRGAGCEIVIDDKSISRAHARLTVGATVRVRDLGSANGVRVGNHRLAANEVVDVRPGQVIELGRVIAVVRPSSLAGGPGRASKPTAAPGKREAIALEATRGALVIASDVMKHVYDLVERIADSELCVLLLGETGVGKEVVAEVVHRYSRRAAGPFLKLNCAAIAPNLLESELFGHEKGAFTGADQAKPGLLESAQRGTVFLDEVGELPMALQAKLLRVIEERKVMRVGGLAPRKIDVRFVSATNQDLGDAMDQKAFRSDLFYRLDGVTIEIPPLRDRREEIAQLAASFAQRAATSAEREPPVFSAEAIATLERYDWPGNVRELRNVVERAVVLTRDGTVTAALFPAHMREGGPRFRKSAPHTNPPAAMPTPDPAPAPPSAIERPATLRSELDALERQRIVDALDKCRGNQTRAAALLGMPLRTLVKRIAAHAIPRPRGREG